MRIVVLDGHTLNPGDLSWNALETLGEYTVHERTAPGQVMDRVHGHQAVLTNKVALPAALLEKLPGLQYIGLMSTGTDVIDLEAAGKRGIVVTNVPDYSTPSVAQLTFALLLELCTQAGPHSEGVRAGKWSRSKDFCYADSPLIELEGLTLGLVGFGRIGRRVASIGRAFGMKVIVCTRRRPVRDEEAIGFVDLEMLFRQSDVVSLHCPLTPATRGLVDAERLACMKSSAFLVNTARGPLVDEAALAEALNDGKIAGAALDVLSSEPPPANNPLLNARNCLITPHLGWATTAARRRLMEMVVSNLQGFLAGQARNVVRAG